jgi:hypothetical protein
MEDVSTVTLGFKDRVVMAFAKILGAKLPTRTGKVDILPEYAVEPFGETYREAKIFDDRVSIVIDAWRMYQNDDRVRSQLDGISEDATQSDKDGRPFKVEFQVDDEGKANEAQEIEGRLYEVMNKDGVSLIDNADEAIKWTLLEGDRYYRLVPDFSKNEIAELRYVKGPREGFLTLQLTSGPYKGNYVQYEIQSRRAVQGLYRWEVIHFCWNKIRLYGLGMYSSARRNWDRLSESERKLYIARDQSAWHRIGREFPESVPDAVIEKLQAKYDKERKKKGGRDVTSEIWHKGKLNLIDPSNTALSHIEDIEYAEKKLLNSGKRPKALLGGYGEHINRAVLDRQEERYVLGLIDKVSQMYGKGVKKFVETQLTLWGYVAEDWPFKVVWATKSLEDQEVKNERYRDMVDRGACSPQTYCEAMGLNWKQEKARMDEYNEWLAEKSEEALFQKRLETEIGEE